MLNFRNPPIAVLILALACAACQVSRQGGSLDGTASDEWTRTYTLTEGGELNITSQNGTVEMEGVDGNAVEVRVERIAHASNDQAAAEIVPRINIKEEVAAGKVAVRTEPLGGIVIGVRVETHYHVRAPKSAMLRIRGSGKVSVKGFTGRVIVTGVNGTVTGEDLSGGVEARSVNGDTDITMTSFGADLVDIRATNGHVVLTIPGDANANLNATVTNGRIDVSELNFEPLGADQSRRRVRGKLNAGGTPIELAAVNGNITVRSK